MTENVPENANQGCVGIHSESAGKASGCAGCPNQSACASGVPTPPDSAPQSIRERLRNVKHKILVLSGKGGVGKSTIACQFAFSLAQKGFQVGLLDIDITGPSVPRMLGLLGQEVHQSAGGWSPVYVGDNLGVMSIGFMLPNLDDAIIWRGPKKSGIIKQFLMDVEWGDLDYLIIDTPPGTSDEHISVVQYMKEADLDGAVVVTTPQEVALMDVRKELNFCRKTNVRVLGVIENMSALERPIREVKFLDTSGIDATEIVKKVLQTHAPQALDYLIQTQVFPSTNGGAKAMADAFQVPFLGRLPLDPNMTNACEDGISFVEAFPTSSASASFQTIVNSMCSAHLRSFRTLY
ncbi:hypothetical protein ABG067_004983 [Albugo candida]